MFHPVVLVFGPFAVAIILLGALYLSHLPRMREEEKLLDHAIEEVAEACVEIIPQTQAPVLKADLVAAELRRVAYLTRGYNWPGEPGPGEVETMQALADAALAAAPESRVESLRVAVAKIGLTPHPTHSRAA